MDQFVGALLGEKGSRGGTLPQCNVITDISKGKDEHPL